MRSAFLLLLSIFITASAHAQSFGSYSLTPMDGGFNGTSPTGAPLSTDLVWINRMVSPGIFSTAGLSLSSFASAADLQAANGRINQVFQQLQQTQQQMAQLYRGIAAAVAIGSAPMPSAPGRLSWSINASAFQSDLGAGLSFAYRLPTPVPMAVTASYGNGGGIANVGRIGLMGEF